jgi:hypothetical protein
MVPGEYRVALSVGAFLTDFVEVFFEARLETLFLGAAFEARFLETLFLGAVFDAAAAARIALPILPVLRTIRPVAGFLIVAGAI